jgi:glycosyltransferase involved in cell wall biosynthesis
VKEIHILYVTNFFSPNNDGFSNASTNFAKILKEKFKLSVFTQVIGTSDDIVLEEKVHRIKIISTIPVFRYLVNRIYLSIKIKEFVSRNKIDLIFIETFTDPVLLCFLGKSILEKCAVRIHSTEDTERMAFSNEIGFLFKRLLIKYFLASRIKSILSTNQYHLDFYKKHILDDNIYKICKVFFLVIPNFLEPFDHELRFNEEICRIKEVKDRITLLFVGKMSSLGILQKGHFDLIHAIGLFDFESLSKFRLVCVGRGDFYKEFKARLQMINGLESEVHEYLSKDLIQSIIRDSDAILLPSRFEGLSMFALEGLSYFKPLIVANCGGLRDLICEPKITFEPQDIFGLYHSINYFLNLNFDAKINLATQSKYKFSTLFNFPLEKLIVLLVAKNHKK